MVGGIFLLLSLSLSVWFLCMGNILGSVVILGVGVIMFILGMGFKMLKFHQHYAPIQKTQKSKKPKKSKKLKSKKPKEDRKILFPYGKNVFFCELSVCDYYDNYNLTKIFESIGMTRLKFRLPYKFNKREDRNKSHEWVDTNHAKADVVADSIVTPLVDQLLTKFGWNNQNLINIAVIGDSTTAHCYDTTHEVTYPELSIKVKESLNIIGRNNVRVDFFASTGSSFSGKNCFFSQIHDVLNTEIKYKGKYDCLLLIGGWNACASELNLKGGRLAMAYELCKTWHENIHQYYDQVSRMFVPFRN